MNRIETALQALQEKEEKAFITYITAGLPDYDKTKAIIKAQEAAGTDIIELGIPFSDPVADGPVIQAASYEAILGGANLEKTFTCMKEMRTDGVQIPVVFMMYYNTVLHYGVEKFVKECNACGVDGLIIPDLPLEEQEELPYYRTYLKLAVNALNILCCLLYIAWRNTYRSCLILHSIITESLNISPCGCLS